MQEGFNISKKLKEVVKSIDESKYFAVIATRFINNEKTLFYKYGYKDMVKPCDFELIPEVASLTLDSVIDKSTYGLSIHRLLFTLEAIDGCKSPWDALNIEDFHVDIIGVETDACVLATMFNLWDAGFEFNLLASETKDIAHENAANLIMKRNFLNMNEIKQT